MPHFLCFTDLSLTTTTPGHPIKSSVVATDAVADSAPPSSSSAAPACGATFFFVRDGDKKSSFALERPVALVNESSDHHERRRGDDGIARQTLAPPPSSPATADGDDDCADEEELEQHGGGNHDHNESQLLFEKGSRDDYDAGGGGKKFASATAAASITSCCVSSVENGDSGSASSSREEKFLFGGFELIANVGTVEVHAVRSKGDAASIPSAAEAYLTTCKGVPMRDLPGLSTIPLCVDGTTSGSKEELCKEIKYGLDERSANIERDILFYKFIFVMPGGPKPMERVRLKFARMNDVSPPVHGLIIVRTLKVKGRLSDSVPKKIPGGQSFTSRQSTPPPIGPAANFFPGGMPSSVEGRDGMSGGLASMMAMFGGGDDGAMIGASSMESSHNMNPRQHQIRQMQLQSRNPRNSQHRRDDDDHRQHRQEKNHAEIMSSVAGLGIFLRSSEERMSDKLETMLAGMEMRITNRLDSLAARLDAIEQSLVPTTSQVVKNDENHLN